MNAVSVQISDAQCLGFKGPQATVFAQTLGALPEPNQWNPLGGGARLLRLGHNEYLIDAPGPAALAPWRERVSALPAGVIEVLRQDAAMDLHGPAVHDLLRQTCALDFGAPQAPRNTVTMTQLIGVAVVATGQGAQVRLLFDPTWAHYMAHELQAIAAELNARKVSGGEHDPR